MYCNTAWSAAEPKEICLQCFSRHLKSRCSTRMRLLRENWGSKCWSSTWSYPHQDQQALLGARGGLWPRNSKGKAQLEGGQETGQGMEQETALPSWACWCLPCSANWDQKSLLSLRHTQCQPAPSHSCLETLSLWFMWYLLMAQGWHQILHSSQRSAWCIWLVGWEKALQFWFLVKQHSLKREAKTQK